MNRGDFPQPARRIKAVEQESPPLPYASSFPCTRTITDWLAVVQDSAEAENVMVSVWPIAEVAITPDVHVPDAVSQPLKPGFALSHTSTGFPFSSCALQPKLVPFDDDH